MRDFHFTTIVSKIHLYKFLAMRASLERHAKNYRIYVLCADQMVYSVLKTISFPDVQVFKLQEIEDEELLKAKQNRIFHAYCWTLKSYFLDYILCRYPDARWFAHVDADLCFFSNPEAIFKEAPEASLYLTHHRNSEEFFSYYAITGIYNTGFVGLKPDTVSQMAVRQWKERCLIECPIKEDPVRKVFGDQRHVEDWPENFNNVHIVSSIGANAAMWNITSYAVTKRENQVLLNETPLIFYHFSGLSIISRYEYNLCWYFHIMDQNITDYIYRPYLFLLSCAIGDMQRYFPWFHEGLVRRNDTPDTHYYILK